MGVGVGEVEGGEVEAPFLASSRVGLTLQSKGID